jgi:signal transduction histidine kinase
VKRKLVTGLGLITLIFILSGVFILKNLDVITSSQEPKEHQERILTRYDSILYNMKGAQAELYRQQAGYSRDIDTLVEYVLQLEDMLSRTKRDYLGYLGNAVCNNCHSARQEIDTLERILAQTGHRLDGYKEKISRIVTLKDTELAKPLEKEAAKDGEEIINAISGVRHATQKMQERMEEVYLSSVRRSTYSIVIAIVVSIVLSSLIVIVIMRSITGPVNVLVKGIESVSSGSYDSKVDIASDDEIGFLAKTFNTMTDNLTRTTGEKEKLMRELQELNDDLERRVQEATEEIKITHEYMLRRETLSTVGTFASGVAHELATPLSSIISCLQMIRGRMPEQLTEDLDLMEGELHRCRNILRGMLSFARAPEKHKTVTDINSLLRELLRLIRYQPEYRKIVITENLDPDLPTVMAIPGQLRQVFMNVIVNALQSMPGEGEVSVSTSAAGDKKNIVVDISDTGCGIPESEMSKIFRPFYTSKNSGTGLGLSISYGIIRGHGGDIMVKSAYGKGTTFSLCLPVIADVPLDDAAATSPSSSLRDG